MSLSSRALKLCLVTNLKGQSFSNYRPFLFKAIEGGVTSVQLREKTSSLNEFHQLAMQMKDFLHPFAIPLIINDHVDIAKAVDAEGVHIGQSDIGADEARKILGPGKIIGLSVETIEEVELANRLTSIDYIAASAVFKSRTKPDCKTWWGLSGLQKVVQMSKYPVMAIGGIQSSNIEAIMEHGACGAAVIGAIHNAPDVKQSVLELISKINVNDERMSICMKR